MRAGGDVHHALVTKGRHERLMPDKTAFDLLVHDEFVVDF